MNETADIRGTSLWRALGNSAGFWIFLFAAFALLSLSVGEERIQKRMKRYHVQLEGQREAFEKASRTSTEQSSDNPSKNRSDDRANTPYQYQLAGLRWILGIAAIAGLGIMIFTACSHQHGSLRPRDAASL